MSDVKRWYVPEAIPVIQYHDPSIEVVSASDYDAALRRAEEAEAALKKIATVHCALVSGSCKPPYLCVTCIARAALSGGKIVVHGSFTV